MANFLQNHIFSRFYFAYRKYILNMLKTYTVGGAVRDQLLGLNPKEIDTVVIGSSPQEMVDLGFIPVGKHFPVFLHPKTHAEFALARKERKVTAGHQGFEFFTDSSITLEQDLFRRDLTINAMAQDEHGHIIDPYKGQEDLNSRTLRHVSDAFIEDPLRVFRVARFMAQLGSFNFTIAPETLKLMQEMTQSGELEALSHERIWEETLKAFKCPRMDLYFKTLEKIGVLDCYFKNFNLEEFDRLQEYLVLLSQEHFTNITIAIFLFNTEILLKIPKKNLDFIQFSRKFHGPITGKIKDAEALASLLEKMDCKRKRERFLNALVVSQFRLCIPGMDWTTCLPNVYLLDQGADIVRDLPTPPLDSTDRKLSGLKIQQKIHEARVKALEVLFLKNP
jgi:tRNA nucleotidyltransferase/poly(A) polymerase